jgi:hypothetical protein
MSIIKMMHCTIYNTIFLITALANYDIFSINKEIFIFNVWRDTVGDVLQHINHRFCDRSSTKEGP